MGRVTEGLIFFFSFPEELLLLVGFCGGGVDGRCDQRAGEKIWLWRGMGRVEAGLDIEASS